MASFDHQKYPAYQPVKMTSRRWPDQTITSSPLWCSVDLRDGNQALVEPMTAAQKSRLYDQLVKVGFKEIEVGFPSASAHDYEFVRDLIEKTFEALKGAKRAVLHVYNSTSTVQREKVFKLDREGITKIAVEGAKMGKDYADKYPETEWVFEYSPERFTGTELDYAIVVCNAVIGVWQPTP